MPKRTDFVLITFFITSQPDSAKQCSASRHIALHCRLFGCYTRDLGLRAAVTKHIYCFFFTIFFKWDWNWYPYIRLLNIITMKKNYDSSDSNDYYDGAIRCASTQSFKYQTLSKVRLSKTMRKNRIGKSTEIGLSANWFNYEFQKIAYSHVWDITQMCKCRICT